MIEEDSISVYSNDSVGFDDMARTSSRFEDRDSADAQSLDRVCLGFILCFLMVYRNIMVGYVLVNSVYLNCEFIRILLIVSQS